MGKAGVGFVALPIDLVGMGAGCCRVEIVFIRMDICLRWELLCRNWSIFRDLYQYETCRISSQIGVFFFSLNPLKTLGLFNDISSYQYEKKVAEIGIDSHN